MRVTLKILARGSSAGATSRRGRCSRGGLAALTIAVGFLALAASAAAKLPCEQEWDRGTSLAAIRHLPDRLQAGTTYQLTITARGALTRVPDARPRLTLFRCGRRLRDRPMLRFESSPATADGTRTLDLRFPRAGRWALVIQDAFGGFRFLGIHRVSDASAARGADPTSLGPVNAPAPLAIGVGTGLVGLLVVGVVLTRRRRLHG